MRGLLLGLVAISLLLADGGMFVPVDQQIEGSGQVAVVKFFDGREELSVSTGFLSRTSDLAWVLPLPSEPQVDSVNSELFSELYYFTRPIYRRGTGLNCGFGMNAPYEDGRGLDTSGVEEISHGIIGDYTYQVLLAFGSDTLEDYLRGHGYAIPDDAAPVFEHYLQQGWNYFVIARVRDSVNWYDRRNVGIKLSFASDSIRYPLYISRLGSFASDVILYVVAGHRQMFPGARLRFSDRVDATTFPDFPDFIDRPAHLTKLYKHYRREEMQDLVLRQAPDDKPFRPIEDSGGWMYGAAGLVLGLGFILLRRAGIKRGHDSASCPLFPARGNHATLEKGWGEIMLSIIAIVVSLALPAAASEGQNPGCVFLEIWPSARATALAGAMTALADEPDAAYWNPGGLGFQKSFGANASHCNWLPGLYPGMYLEYASAGFGIPIIPKKTLDLNLGLNSTYLTTGKTVVVDEHGNILGSFTSFDEAAAIHGGVQLLDVVGVGFNFKYIYSFVVPDWVFRAMPELGIEGGGTGTTFAVDFGVLCKPVKSLSVGLSVANLGPNISYTASGESDSLPRTLRFGLAFTPINSPVIRTRALLEADKILVGMFYDPEHTKTFREKLRYELLEAWKSVGCEVTLLQILSLRAGYFEDVTGARYGICWGLGLGYKDFVRLDMSNDALIYDFETSNVKLALTLNNIGGLIGELSKGKSFDWMP
jgi:hypothetical protein